MKNLSKVLLMAMVGVCASLAHGQAIDGVFTKGSTGTTSATVVIPNGTGFAEIQDIGYRIDSGVTSATIDIRSGKIQKPINSATSGSGSVLWFDNSDSSAAVGGYVIYNDVSAGTYALMRVMVAATTSITTLESTGVATVTSDYVYPLNTAVRKPAAPVSSATLSTAVSVWLPAGLPSAITLDGNTTACQIEVSGIRSNFTR